MSTAPDLPQLVDVPGGRFAMGSCVGRDDERPVRDVEVSPFAIGRTAVTNRQHARFVAATAAPRPPAWSRPGFDGPDQPVVTVSWFEAVAYCEWLSRLTGAVHRLPTEAEREWACRAGTTTRYPWGDDPARDLGAYGASWGRAPEAAGGPPNGFGLLNMADNVHEWCWDWHAAYEPGAARDPRGPASGHRRASRGGSWRHRVPVTPSAARSSLDPSFRYDDYGFRVVRA